MTRLLPLTRHATVFHKISGGTAELLRHLFPDQIGNFFESKLEVEFGEKWQAA
jgi:hypothetical protein